MEASHSAFELFFALLFVSAIWAYIARELIKVRRTNRMEINQPSLPSLAVVRQLCQFLWLLGLYSNHREEITVEERPFLYRFLSFGLYLVFISFSVAWMMVASQLIETVFQSRNF